jgi:hypothetical protein
METGKLFVGKRTGDRRGSRRPDSFGRRAEDRERAAWASFLDGCQRHYVARLIRGEAP